MKKLLSVILMPLALAACSDSSVQEVQQWMDKTKLETRPAIPKLKEPKDFIPFTYDKKTEIDPFNPIKLMSALAKMHPGNGHGIQPDMERRREALESVTLDSLRMVGTITKGALHYALLQSETKGVYQVKAGNYIGQNFGLVTKVSDDSIEVKEIVLDSGGDWIERLTKLELQEAKK